MFLTHATPQSGSSTNLDPGVARLADCEKKKRGRGGESAVLTGLEGECVGSLLGDLAAARAHDSPENRTDCSVGIELILSALVFTLRFPFPYRSEQAKGGELHVTCMPYTTNRPGSVEKERARGREYMNAQRPPPSPHNPLSASVLLKFPRKKQIQDEFPH